MKTLLWIRRRRDERGMSVMELMVGVGVMVLLSVAALGMLVASQNRVRFVTNEVDSLDQARVAIARITREVRDSANIYSDVDCPSTTCLTIAVDVTSDVRYRYVQADGTLYRSTGARDPMTGGYLAAAPETPLVTRLVNDTANPVFCRLAPCTVPSETAVQIVMRINPEPSKPLQTVPLISYVTPRNQ